MLLGQTIKHSGFVTILGAPNAGKSTFLNKLLESKISIVSPKAQTTRNNIKGIYTREDTQIVFTDTPGITPSDFGKLLNKWMNKYSFSAGKESDLVLFFVDVSTQHPEKGIGESELNIINNLNPKQKTILVANKVDTVKRMRADDTISVFKKKFPFHETCIISAKSGEGMDSLLEKVVSELPEGPLYFPEDYLSDQEDDFLVAEIIREKMFLLLRQELPYSIAVTVETIKDIPEKKLIDINATIHVAKKSQKGMIIGKGGQTLHDIGKSAREELEQIFGTKVALHLFVRVEERWFEKESLLKKMGYEKDFEN